MEKEETTCLYLIAAGAEVLSFAVDKGHEDNKYRQVSIEFRNPDSEFGYSGIIPKEELEVVGRALAGVLAAGIPVNIYQDLGSQGTLRGVSIRPWKDPLEQVLLRGPILTHDEKK